MSSFTDWYENERTDEWGTPPEVWRPISRAVGGFDLDPCSGAEQSRIASSAYTIEDDGLRQSWFGAVWINPPYSDIPPWLECSIAEVRQDNVDTVVLLLPVRSSTQWWHTYVSQASLICFLEGRVSHQSAKERDGDGHNSPFPSAIVVYGDYTEDLPSALESKGLVYEQDQRYKTSEQTALSEVA